MSVLVLAEHDNTVLKDATLAAVTAAGQLGGDVHLLVAGKGAQGVADAAAKVVGVAKVLLADDAAYENALAENLAPLITALMAGYDAFVAPATTRGKNVAPRVAAALDVAQISEILSVEGPDTFTRPIYAGNAIATVKSSDAKKVITVRGTAFAKAATSGGSAAIEAAGGPGDAGLSAFAGAELTTSARPELTAAKIIVSGGRALGSSENSTSSSIRSPTSWVPPLAPRAPPSMPVMRRTTIRLARLARSSPPNSIWQSAFRAPSSIWRA